MVKRIPSLVAAALGIVACAACAQTQTLAASSAATCGSIEIAETAVAGSPGARQFYTTDGDAISVAEHSLVTTPDVADARPAIAEGHQVLEIDLGAASAEALRAFTAAHVGARLAFIVDGRVRNVARILDPIQGQGLIIDPVTPSEASGLVQCLHERPGEATRT